ncbi:MAG: formylglycine-generating enzyme family protein [Gemmatimonadales bacterium]|nr:formylglycine-generating enzyme family protein [Gemmatimonadales bacterium]
MPRFTGYTFCAVLIILGLFMIGCGDEEFTGTIVINPTPDDIDAPWTLSGQTDQSGIGSSKLTEMPVGEYTLTWGNIPGYSTPSNQPQNLSDGGTITFSGTYVDVEENETGTIQIFQIPDDLDGASWSLTGPFNAAASGDTILTDMPVGDYTLTWEEVPEWFAPADEIKTQVAGETLTFNGVYKEIVLIGTIEINQIPDVLVDAGWSLTGPLNESGAGDSSLTNMPIGEYTLAWDDVTDYITPSSSQQTLVQSGKESGETIYFNGTYIHEGFVQIPPESVSMPVTYTMGSTTLSDETPHQVTLTRRFSMNETEITNSQYVEALQWAFGQVPPLITATSESVLDALDGSTVELIDLDDDDCRITFSGGVFSTTNPDLPVVQVSWYGAAAYCDWMSLKEGLPRAYAHSGAWDCPDFFDGTGYRLPTEGEWEFACRAGSLTHYNTGKCLDSGTEANYDGDYPYPYTLCQIGPKLGSAADVGDYYANAWGLFDMHGNVYEWCHDWYGPYTRDETDPDGANPNASGRILRSGSWQDSARECRSADRAGHSPGNSYATSGFRTIIIHHLITE